MPAKLNTAQAKESVVSLSPQAKPESSKRVASNLLLSSEARELRERSKRLREESEILRERNAQILHKVNEIALVCCELIAIKV